jgi:farnesyl diphosphate synthase
VQALQVTTPAQRVLLEAHYGRDNPKDVAVVKKIYEDINMKKIFKDYEDESYSQLVKMIRGCIQLPQEMFLKLLAKIYKREL